MSNFNRPNRNNNNKKEEIPPTPGKNTKSKKRGRHVEVEAEDEADTLGNRDAWECVSDDDIDNINMSSSSSSSRSSFATGLQHTASSSTSSPSSRMTLLGRRTRRTDGPIRYWAPGPFIEVPVPAPVIEPINHPIRDLIHMEGVALDERRADEELGNVTESLHELDMDSDDGNATKRRKPSNDRK